MEKNIPDLYVCENCVSDNYLKKYIRDNKKDDNGCECSFCHEKSQNVCSYKEFLIFIRERIFFYFEVLPKTANLLQYPIHKQKIEYDNYIVLKEIPEVITTENLLSSVINNQNLINKIQKVIGVIFLKKKHFIYGNMEFKDKWELFSYYVKHNKRFIFENEMTHIKGKKNTNSNENNYNNPIEILNDILTIVQNYKNECFTKIGKKMEIYRARAFSEKQISNLGCEDFLSPPDNKAKSPNRVSPEGISYFYCSDDKDTVISEVENRAPWIYVSKWNILKEQNVMNFEKFIDLCKKNIDSTSLRLGIPGLFAEEDYYLYNFIESFARELHKPCNGNTIDYIPTQIVTEYLKNKIEDVNGVAYKSVYSDKLNYCFFYNYKESLSNEVFLFCENEIESYQSKSRKDNISVNVTVNI